jgi:hypothetical protein
MDLPGLRLDANRMFSRPGAGRNLRRLNPSAPGGRHRRGARFSRPGAAKRGSRVRAAPGRLRIAAYKNGRRIPSTHRHKFPKKFIYPSRKCQEIFYERKEFSRGNPGPPECGVAGQAGREDDGSLACGCAATGARYVDVEAAHGKPDKPPEMNGWLGATLL